MTSVSHPLVPYDQGLHWKAHADYFERRGVAAWTQGDIPHRATNNHAFARQHGALLVELAQSLMAEGCCGPAERIQVLEIAGGLGDFAARLLLALRDELGEAGRALFGRLSYVFTDVSRTSLEQAIQRPPLAGFVASGLVLPALLDATASTTARTLAGEAVTLKPRLTIANYTCCVLPTKVFRKRDDEWLELHARPAGAPPEEGREGANDDPWGRLLGKHAWLPVRLEDVFDSTLHPRLLRQALAHSAQAELAYPYAFVELLDTLLEHMPPGGTFLFSDFEDSSYEGHIGSSPRLPILYGESLNHPVCFPLFPHLARLRGDELLLGPGWYGTARTVLWRRGAPLSPSLREAFTLGFCQHHAGQDRLDFEVAAQKLSEAGSARRRLRSPRARRP